MSLSNAGTNRTPLRLAVFASGSGTTLQNILDRIDAGQLAAKVDVVVSDNSTALALERAKRAGVEAHYVPYAKAEIGSFSELAFEHCRRHGVGLVVLGGFMNLLRIPPDFMQKVVNVHPALIPAFCGKGYYGDRVHRAVLDFGAKVTGCTVHFCDNEYDHGPIILQRVVNVADDDTTATLAHRVQEAEREALPRAIQLFAEGRIELDGRRVRIRP